MSMTAWHSGDQRCFGRRLVSQQVPSQGTCKSVATRFYMCASRCIFVSLPALELKNCKAWHPRR